LTALLVASAASPADLAAALGRSSILDIDALSAAELAGLITVTPAGIAFVHPLLRSAVYYRAPFTARAAAHRELAIALKDQPDRRAWHLSKTTIVPDEQVAALLEATHEPAQERGGFIAATVAMERAAALSPDRGDQARRLLVAAGLARFTDDVSWTEELANQALAIAADPDQKSRARMELGWTLCWTSHHETALGVALPLVSSSSTDLNVRWEALRMAATVTYQAGSSEVRQAVSAALDSLEHDTADQGTPPSEIDQQHWDSTRLFTRLIADPRRIRENLPLINQFGGPIADPLNIGAAGFAAWLGDETRLSLRLLRRAVEASQAHGAGRQSAAIVMALAWALVDAGRWDHALLASAGLTRMAETRGQPFVRALSDLVTATVLAWRGDSAAARDSLTAALANVDPADSKAAGAWARRAAGLISLAEDDDLTAYVQLRRLFDDDGAPLHYHVSYLGVADLADAAARCGRQEEARDILSCVTKQSVTKPSPRLTQQLAYGQALLADRTDAEQWFVNALADPAGEQWPFDRARLRLGYGEWLRRERRITEAKEELTRALTVFDRLGAVPWITRTAREVRATGVRVAGAATALSDLSPQEHQVVYLAAQGLSNRQIGQLLNLSPRTVGAHLYRAFPKLGVTDRRQIRDILPPDGSDDTSPTATDPAPV
jgi:DNA-binding CsgD family transcriptional regulator